jgi:hypothetical protein
MVAWADYIGNVIDCPPPGGPLPCEPALGQVESDRLEITIDVNSEPPNLALTGGPPQGASSNQTSQRFTFTAVDFGAFTVSCSLDRATPAGCSSPVDLTGLADGSHSLEIVAADLNGHVTTVSRNFTVDTTAPVARFNDGPADRSTINSNHPTFDFTASDRSDVSFNCIFDGRPAVPCASPFRKSRLGTGAHFLVVTPRDAVGNTGNPIARMFTFKPVKRCVKHKRVRSKSGSHRRVCAKYRLGSV